MTRRIPVAVLLTKEEIDEIAAARGLVPFSAFVRDVIMDHIKSKKE
ncbi:hypothetical protein KKE60_07240 [Patescibacteria group bacterium]|nr:hypothetical protein [Patescibacteria group bacterium]